MNRDTFSRVSPPWFQRIVNRQQRSQWQPFLEAMFYVNFLGRVIKYGMLGILYFAIESNIGIAEWPLKLVLPYFYFVWRPIVVTYVFFFKYHDKNLWGKWWSVPIAILPMSIPYIAVKVLAKSNFFENVPRRYVYGGVVGMMANALIATMGFGLSWEVAVLPTLLLVILILQEEIFGNWKRHLL